MISFKTIPTSRPRGWMIPITRGYVLLPSQLLVWAPWYSNICSLFKRLDTVSPESMEAKGKTSLELAVQEARSLGHHYLGTEHLLLGLLREEAGLASQVLLKSGVTLEKTRELVKQLLATDQTTSAPESEQHGEP